MNKSDTNFIDTYFDTVIQTLKRIDSSSISSTTDAFLECYKKGKTIYIFGNGGSGATASHVAGDFVKGVSYGLEKRFRMICLNDNYSALAAISNDLSFDEIFVEQLKNFLNEDDLVIGLSGSGNSKNVVKAFEFAKTKNAKTIALCGFSGGKIKMMADIAIHIPIANMEVTEDIHLIVFHTLKHELTKLLRGSNASMGSQYDERVK